MKRVLTLLLIITIAFSNVHAQSETIAVKKVSPTTNNYPTEVPTVDEPTQVWAPTKIATEGNDETTAPTSDVLYAVEVQEVAKVINETTAPTSDVLYAVEVQEAAKVIDEVSETVELPALHAIEEQEMDDTDVEFGEATNLPALSDGTITQEVAVFPTVSSNIIHVTTSLEDFVQLRVFSLGGEMKLDTRFQESYELDISDYASGIYVVHVSRFDTLKTFKFIKQ